MDFKTFLLNTATLLIVMDPIGIMPIVQSLLLPVPRFDVKGKALLATQGKVYIADHGFRQMLFGNNEASIEQVLENIVAVELLRRGWKISVGVGEKNEIDFVATRNKETHYFQVTYLMPSRETAEWEFQALLSVKDNFPKNILSLDEFDFSRDGVLVTLKPYKWHFVFLWFLLGALPPNPWSF